MKIVMLDGCLANQITQYVFYRCLEIASDDVVYLDDLYFHSPLTEFTKKVADTEKPIYQLDKFAKVKPNLISEYFTADVWKEMVNIAAQKPPLPGGSYLPQILKDSGMDFFMIAEFPGYKFDGNVAKMPYYYHFKEMLEAQGNVYYYGYFTHGGWFQDHKEQFLDELTFPPLFSKEDLAMKEAIESSFSICIHVRRGAYNALGFALPTDYYRSAIQKSLKLFRGRQVRYFVFSDDISFCKQNAKQLGLNLISERLTFGKPFRSINENHCDMQLMSLCDGMILSNSVYSYYAALLNQKGNKWVINPVPSRGVFA